MSRAHGKAIWGGSARIALRRATAVAAGAAALASASCQRALSLRERERQVELTVRIDDREERGVVDTGHRGSIVVHEESDVAERPGVVLRTDSGLSVDLGVQSVRRRAGPDRRAVVGVEALREAGAWVFDWDRGGAACARTTGELTERLEEVRASRGRGEWVWVGLVRSPFEVEETSPPFVVAEEARSWLRARGLAEPAEISSMSEGRGIVLHATAVARTRLPVVVAEVDGVRCFALLDTGSSTGVVNECEGRLPVAPLEGDEHRFLGADRWLVGRYRQTRCEVKIGQLTFSPARMVVLSPKRPTAPLGFTVVVGLEVLRQMPMVLDFPNERVGFLVDGGAPEDGRH